jgi:cell division protein FtsB
MDKDKELLSLKEENQKLKENLNKLNKESLQQISRIKKLEVETIPSPLISINFT